MSIQTFCDIDANFSELISNENLPKKTDPFFLQLMMDEQIC